MESISSTKPVELLRVAHTNGDELTLGYNAFGRISTITDGSGRSVHYQYDATGSHLVGTTGARGTIAYSYEDSSNALRNHALLSVTYAAGTHHDMAYDNEGRLVRDSTDGGGSVTYSYHQPGKIHFTDATGSASSVSYNSSLVPSVIVDSLSDFKYDANGSLIRMVAADNTV